jgi:sugar phosphate isomerase/epimerase
MAHAEARRHQGAHERPEIDGKGTFPFRLGTTSYILPDDLVPNCVFLGPLVDDVELILFESHEISNLPDPSAIETLSRLGEKHGLTYTVHLPLDTELGSRDETVRRRSVAKCRRVMALMESLAPFAYIAHFHGDRRGRDPVPDIETWQAALDRSADELLAGGINPCLLCVETLDYPFELIEAVVKGHGLSICLDLGHLAFFGYNTSASLDRYLAISRVVHLHGHQNGADHRNIGLPDLRAVELLNAHPGLMDGKERVVTMEVFGRDDFERSIAIMKRFAR